MLLWFRNGLLIFIKKKKQKNILVPVCGVCGFAIDFKIVKELGRIRMV